MVENIFPNLPQDIRYFQFEEDFVKKNIGCIPMIVRFKLDAVGIKLKLAEWNRLSKRERENLARQPCTTKEEEINCRNLVKELVKGHTGNHPKEIVVEKNPAWSNLQFIDPQLEEKAKEFGLEISLEQWSGLTNLQRFALMKLSRPGHENKNFPKAIKEFELV